jgi:hypothetical protein
VHRRLLNFLTLFSLILSIGVIFIWLVSCRHWGVVEHFSESGSIFSARVFDGAVEFRREDGIAARGESGDLGQWIDPPGRFSFTANPLMAVPALAGRTLEQGYFQDYLWRRSNEWKIGRFDLYAARYSSDSPTTRHCWSATLPDWPIVLMFAGLPLMAGGRSLRRRSRLTSGQCIDCGYDLRAATDRCPECGQAIPSTTRVCEVEEILAQA